MWEQEKGEEMFLLMRLTGSDDGQLKAVLLHYSVL